MASRIASEIVYKIVADEKDFIAGMGLAKKESEKLEKALDGTTKTVNTLNKQEIVWGRTLETLKGQQSALKGEINRLITEGIDPNSNVVKKLKAEYDALGTEIKKFPKTFEQVKKSMANAGKKIEDVGKKLSLGLTAPIVAAGAASIKLASELQDSQNAVNVIFQDGAKIIQDYGKTASETAGLSMSAFNDVASGIGVLLAQTGDEFPKVAQDTVELTQRAADLASLIGGTTKDAALALGAALRGESEPARRYGVILSDNAVKTKALEMGLQLVNGELTEAQKIQVRYNLIMEQSSRAQGDFAKTNGEAKNSAAVLRADIENLSAELGTELLPAIEDILIFARDLAKDFGDLDANGKKLVLTIAGIAAALGPVVTLAGKLIAGGPIAAGIYAIAIAFGVMALNISKAQAEFNKLKNITEGGTTGNLADDLKVVSDRIGTIKAQIGSSEGLIPGETAELEAELASLEKIRASLADKAKWQAMNLKGASEEEKARAKEAVAAADSAKATEASAAITEKYKQSRKLVLDALGKEKTEYQLIQEKIDAISATPWATGQLEKDRLAALEALRARQAEIVAEEDAKAKALADARGDEIIRLAQLEENAHQEELDRIEKERKAREDAANQAAQYIYSQLTTVGDQLLQNEIDRINASTLSEKEKAIEIAKVKQKQAIFDKAQALANIAMRTSEAIVSALTVPPPAGEILAGVIGGLAAVQAAAVIAQPLPPIPSFAKGTRNFMVPPGFPNDSFPIMVQSGERVTVETPQQQVGEQGERMVFQIGTVIADPAGLRELDRLIRKYGSVEDARRG